MKTPFYFPLFVFVFERSGLELLAFIIIINFILACVSVSALAREHDTRGSEDSLRCWFPPVSGEPCFPGARGRLDAAFCRSVWITELPSLALCWSWGSDLKPSHS